ncbi:Aste57867_15465 [Aphanomyces stellatus]|uniref:Aste57867_15465 protein n=1 Tax=Aphanomyces stellatus TaxID=120398 RepID=A0A485L369_9STRA|nr:hypothetical protein As57867_015409 [Aphanomyces stellatus]VFT92267.1 Aste57867_15465 [Aphanomyces stellatus]
MRLGEYMWSKRYHILFTTQGLTLAGIYGTRFGYLDGFVDYVEGIIGTDDEKRPVVVLPGQEEQGRAPIWKKAMEISTEKKDS